MGLHSQNTIIAIKKLWPDRVDLTGGTVGASSITGITQVMKDDFYKGGKMIVLDGNQAGREYRITNNDAAVITVDHANLTESGNAVANTDSVALFPNRYIPIDDNEEWILVDSATDFTPAQEWQELFSQRAGGLPYRTDSFLLKSLMNPTIDYTFQDASLFPLMFGKCVDTAATEGTTPLSSTLSQATYPGETIINVVSATNADVNDYIRVDTASEGEIRKITAINTLAITLDKPLRREHANGVTVIEMEDAANTLFTHIYTEFYGTPLTQWPFVIKSVYNSQCGNNSIAMWGNYQVSSANFKNDAEKFMVSLGLKGINFRYKKGLVEGTDDTSTDAAFLTDSTADFLNEGVSIGMTVTNVTDGSTATITGVTKTTIAGTLSGGTDDDWDSSDVYTVDIFTAPTALTDTPALYYNSEVSINGTVDGTVRTVNTGYDLQGEERFYQNDYTNGYPSEVVFKRPSHTGNLGIRIDNEKFLALLTAGSKFDNYVKYNLNTAGTQYIKVELKNCRPTMIPHPFPAGGAFEADMTLMQQYLQVTVVDDNQYF